MAPKQPRQKLPSIQQRNERTQTIDDNVYKRLLEQNEARPSGFAVDGDGDYFVASGSSVSFGLPVFGQGNVKGPIDLTEDNITNDRQMLCLQCLPYLILQSSQDINKQQEAYSEPMSKLASTIRGANEWKTDSADAKLYENYMVSKWSAHLLTMDLLTCARKAQELISAIRLKSIGGQDLLDATRALARAAPENMSDAKRMTVQSILNTYDSEAIIDDILAICQTRQLTRNIQKIDRDSSIKELFTPQGRAEEKTALLKLFHRLSDGYRLSNRLIEAKRHLSLEESSLELNDILEKHYDPEMQALEDEETDRRDPWQPDVHCTITLNLQTAKGKPSLGVKLTRRANNWSEYEPVTESANPQASRLRLSSDRPILNVDDLGRTWGQDSQGYHLSKAALQLIDDLGDTKNKVRSGAEQLVDGIVNDREWLSDENISSTPDALSREKDWADVMESIGRELPGLVKTVEEAWQATTKWADSVMEEINQDQTLDKQDQSRLKEYVEASRRNADPTSFIRLLRWQQDDAGTTKATKKNKKKKGKGKASTDNDKSASTRPLTFEEIWSGAQTFALTLSDDIDREHQRSLGARAKVRAELRSIGIKEVPPHWTELRDIFRSMRTAAQVVSEEDTKDAKEPTGAIQSTPLAQEYQSDDEHGDWTEIGPKGKAVVKQPETEDVGDDPGPPGAQDASEPDEDGPEDHVDPVPDENPDQWPGLPGPQPETEPEVSRILDPAEAEVPADGSQDGRSEQDFDEPTDTVGPQAEPSDLEDDALLTRYSNDSPDQMERTPSSQTPGQRRLGAVTFGLNFFMGPEEDDEQASASVDSHTYSKPHRDTPTKPNPSLDSLQLGDAPRIFVPPRSKSTLNPTAQGFVPGQSWNGDAGSSL